VGEKGRTLVALASGEPRRFAARMLVGPLFVQQVDRVVRAFDLRAHRHSVQSMNLPRSDSYRAPGSRERTAG
jgi:hypothetical protein